MTIERYVIRNDEDDRTSEVIRDIWVSKKKSTRKKPIEESMDDIVWIAGKKGEFHNRVVSSIGKSSDFICFSTYLFGDEDIEEALLEASDRGVRVYMLCPSEGMLDRAMEDEDDFDERAKEHTEFLDRVADRVLIRSAQHLHSKFILIDPMNPESREGFLSTANFNRALYNNLELMVKLSDGEIESLFKQFVHGFWEQAQTQHKKIGEGKGDFLPISQPPSDLNTSMRSCDLPTTVKSDRSDYENLSLRREILGFISSSEGPLTITTYGIDVDHEVTKSIIAQTESRDVTVLVPLRTANSQAYTRLCSAGVTLLGIDKLHAKVIAGEKNGEQTVLLMTANLQPKGLDTGFETGVVLKDERKSKVLEIIGYWKKSASWIYKESLEIGNATEEILVAGERRYVPELIPESVREELPDVQQISLDNEPKPRRKKTKTLAKKVEYSWRVIRPVLPKDAQKLEEESAGSRPLFRKGNQLFITVSDEDEVPKAIRIKQSKYKGARIVIAE